MRCELTELLPEQCGCPQHRNSPALTATTGEVRLTVEFHARFPSWCSLDRTHPIHPGDVVSYATLDGEKLHGPICADCREGVLT